METKQNPHKDHRKRLFARYENYGFDSFEEHNVLELLLFYSIPRADTNPTAHALLDRFGSLYDVLRAPETELCKVEGVGPASARLIRTVMETAREAELRKLMAKPLVTYERLVQYATEWFSGKPAGTVAVILLDQKDTILHTETLAQKHTEVPASYAEAILSAAAHWKASRCILMHNHADGMMQASYDDRMTTERLYHALADAGVALIEHVIVHDFDILPILDESVRQAVSPFTRKDE